jgi:hypothetical protein
MNFPVMSQKHLNELNPGDIVKVFIRKWPKSLYPNQERLKDGTFVGKTKTGKLSIQLKDGRIWVHGNGQRSMECGPNCYLDYAIVEER